MKILVLNSGSSSQKSSLYELGDCLPEIPPKPHWEGKIEWDGNQAELQIATAQGTTVKDQLPSRSRPLATDHLLNYLWSGQARVIRNVSEIDIVGHRIVNGGSEYREPTFITTELKTAIERMAAFAPIHNRAELEGIEIMDPCRKWPCLTPAFTAICRKPPSSTRDPTTGLPKGSVDMDFTESTINIVPSALRNSLASICNH